MDTFYTKLSKIDSQGGQLVIRGRTLDELSPLGFEEFAAWLLDYPVSGLGRARLKVCGHLRPLLPMATHLAPMEWLRFACDSLPGDDPDELVAALAMALVLRHNPGAQPDAEAGHVQDVSRMLWGPEAAWKAEALRSYWVCVAEHGFNASTFAARVVASTQAGARAAVCAALGALQGPLHGGAPGPVLDMLDELGQTEDVEGWVAAKLAAGERLMGFGHRVYRARDPRAEMLLQACQKLNGGWQQARQLEGRLSAALQRLKPGRPLHANVEYYTALLLQSLGFERDTFTAVFACGRVLGWLAHIAEQREDGRLIRPEAVYQPG